jgi:hypothetical protein
MQFRKMAEGDLNQRCVLQLRNFESEEQEHAVLIRYLTLEKFLSLLEFEAVWFSRLGALQDKFEGTLPKKAHELSMTRSREIDAKIAIPQLQPIILRMTDEQIETCRETTTVNCWFLGDKEIQKMWRDYGQDGQGIAIRSTVKRLRTAFLITGDYANVTLIGRVQYVDFDSHEIPANLSDGMDVKTFLKEKSFVWEQEVRIVTFNTLHNGCLNSDGSPFDGQQSKVDNLENRKGFFVKCRLTELIQSVIVGPNAQPHFFTLIKRLADRYQLNVPVEKSQLLPWK